MCRRLSPLFSVVAGKQKKIVGWRDVVLVLIIIAGLSRPGQAAGPFSPFLETGNNDNYADLAIGVPGEEWNSGETNAGVAHVLYPGSDRNLLDDPSQMWHQGSDGLFGLTEADDFFGSALAACDFNGDNYVDLAVGVPYQDVGLSKNGSSGTAANAGAVHVLYASSSGLTAADNAIWDQDDWFLADEAEAGDWFGQALACGDFNGDGYDDLAVGIPAEDIESGGTRADAGAVHVIYGTSGGLASGGNQFWRQGGSGLSGSPNADDRFGYALAVGDFNRDGRDDLAVGIPHEGLGTSNNYGSVQVLYGSQSAGLTAAGNQLWYQGIGGLQDVAEDGDVFGWALTTGDFDGDGYDDLAIGVPGEDIDSGGVKSDAGAVHAIYGASGGLASAGNQFWTQAEANSSSLAVETGDRFGRALAAGDFDGDGYDDLAIGVPYEDITIGVDTIVDAGCLNALVGSNGKLVVHPSGGSLCWVQSDFASGSEGAMEANDYFGAVLAAGDLDSDGRDDLVIGVPDEDVVASGIQMDAGVVQVVYGGGSYIFMYTSGQLLHQSTGTLGSYAEANDRFGGVVAVLPNTVWRVYLPLISKNQ